MEPIRKPTANNEAIKGQANAAHGLRDLFEVGLKDIYYSEKILSKTLPNMVKNASTPELVNTLKNQLTETNEHVSRLEQIFDATGIKPEAKKCDAMEGILKESENLISKTDVGTVRDASIIASKQKVKHYEIATYGTLHAYAQTLGESKAANLLAMSLEEEKKADAALTGIATASINPGAYKADSTANPKM